MSYTEDQQWALEQFDALIIKAGSQNKACKMVGISPAVYSPIKNGTYEGNVGAQLEKLISYFRTKTAANEMPSAASYNSEYVPTSISTHVYEVIRNCHLQGSLAIACGDAGIGKTKAAIKYYRDYPNDAIYLAANPCLSTIKSLLKHLCNKVNVATSRTIDEMWLGLAGRLRDGQVIIIDEAQHLPIKTVEALRAITDYFAEVGQTLGIVFIGNTETVTRFGGTKKAEFAQISNRTRQRKVYKISDIKREDIQLLFPDLQDAMSIDFLLSIARSPQALRGAVNLYNNALDNDNTTYQGLVGMAKHMEMRV